MFALIQNTPPGAAMLIVTALVGILAGFRALVACWLGIAAIRASRPEDLARVLAAIRALVDSAFRFRR